MKYAGIPYEAFDSAGKSNKGSLNAILAAPQTQTLSLLERLASRSSVESNYDHRTEIM